MRVLTMHEGVTKEMIRDNTGFDIEIPDNGRRYSRPPVMRTCVLSAKSSIRSAVF